MVICVIEMGEKIDAPTFCAGLTSAGLTLSGLRITQLLFTEPQNMERGCFKFEEFPYLLSVATAGEVGQVTKVISSGY